MQAQMQEGEGSAEAMFKVLSTEVPAALWQSHPHGVSRVTLLLVITYEHHCIQYVIIRYYHLLFDRSVCRYT